MLQVADSASSQINSLSKGVNWAVENRLGFAKLVGFLLVPSQFIAPDLKECQKTIRNLESQPYVDIEQATFEHEGKKIQAVICYPKGYDKKDNAKCTLYNNPNGATVAEFFGNGFLQGPPGDILQMTNAPVILYDYRGTGLSRNENSWVYFKPTYESIVQDGERALEFALSKFDEVEAFGSSLGGGVATVSLDRHLEANAENYRRVTLINHDSFTTTSRVLLPNHASKADWLGWLVGGNLDAVTPMKSLIEKGVKVKVLNHAEDPIIPKKARMIEVASKIRNTRVSTFLSPFYGHANLSWDMQLFLDNK